ncbi:MAG: site-specific DNA-methyltransferase [Paludibacter sp.]
MAEQEFINAGFTVVGTETSENKLLSFLKENYPNIIRDTEINLEELKTVLGLPIDEKVNGYGLNFVGRNFARAKYAQKTDKELHLNTALSKGIDTTQNLVLKGDNLESLKILKNFYSGQINCIYIDPPYNTTSEEFVYPDKFDKEEAEVLGLANLSESDFARMDFSFKTKKSHNGWLAFMYPRLLLARDLLMKDGIMFISIDEHECHNLIHLVSDLFGDDSFETIIWRKNGKQGNTKKISRIKNTHEFIVGVYKNKFQTSLGKVKLLPNWKLDKTNPDSDPRGNWESGIISLAEEKSDTNSPNYYSIELPSGRILTREFYVSKEDFKLLLSKKKIFFPKDGDGVPRLKIFENEEQEYFFDSIIDEMGTFSSAKEEIELIFGNREIFDTPKPTKLLKEIIRASTNDVSIILDFFAGSGTTGQAVMQLNAEDGGKRKFILCQVDEPIKEDKPAYKFCIDNNLPPVISSITIERLKRAGEKIAKDVEAENSKSGMFEENKKQVPDIGFKVFDSVEAPKLKVDEKGQISITENETDALSRIYNMIFTVGLDEPTQVPEEVVKDCIYKIGNHYYITNSQKITSDDYSNAIKNGKVFIDGWTASLNGTLQNYKEDVKIVF